MEGTKKNAVISSQTAAVFFLDFFTAVIYVRFFTLLSVYKYLFGLVRGKIS